MSKSYFEKLRDPRWQKRRLEVFEKDFWECQMCGNKELTLNVHHRYYIPRKQPWEYPDEMLATLCENCHFRVTDLTTALTLLASYKSDFEYLEICAQMLTGDRDRENEFKALLKTLKLKHENLRPTTTDTPAVLQPNGTDA